MPIFEAKIAVLRKVKADLDDIRGLLDDADDSTGELEHKLQALQLQLRRDLLQIGAAGRLLMEGKIEAILPLEDVAAYKAANPVAKDGAVALDQNRIEARQDAQAKRLLGAGKIALIILGGAHDLSDNLDRLSGGKAEYIRVATKQWQEFAGDVGREEPNKPR